jgi:hypothetical protein
LGGSGRCEGVGWCAPQVDAVHACGRYVVGLNLVSATVMELRPAAEAEIVPGVGPTYPRRERDALVRLHLPRRCAYVLCDEARFAWTHAIPRGPDLTFHSPCTGQDVFVRRKRRIVVIMRDRPLGAR